MINQQNQIETRKAFRTSENFADYLLSFLRETNHSVGQLAKLIRATCNESDDGKHKFDSLPLTQQYRVIRNVLRRLAKNDEVEFERFERGKQSVKVYNLT